MVQTCISTEKAPWDILSNYLTTGLFFFFFGKIHMHTGK